MPISDQKLQLYLVVTTVIVITEFDCIREKSSFKSEIKMCYSFIIFVVNLDYESFIFSIKDKEENEANDFLPHSLIH